MTSHPGAPAVCAACGRTRPRHARGYCAACYIRWWRTHGPIRDPLPRLPPVIDDLVVEHLTAGQPTPGATPAERRAAAVILTRRGLSAAVIADRLRCTPRTVIRYRARERAAQAP